MTLGEAMLRFGFNLDRSSVGAVENTVNNLKGMAKKALGAIGVAFTISGLADLAEAAADAQATASQFTQVFGDLETQAGSSLSKIAKDTGMLENRLKASYTQISAFAKTTGMETSGALQLADRSMKAVADSAAFYDRSLEDVTASLQSFLKGNFENDSALGLSCTETTRNTAANALYGKSFKDLAEDQKQLTLLKMVEDANKASGALGQASRESDTWTNQLGNLMQALKDMKAAAGSGILQPAVQALKLLTGFVQKATAVITKMTGETGILTRAFQSMFNLVKKIKPSIDRLMRALSTGASKGISQVKKMVDRLGGMGNILKILAVVAASFVAVMAWAKIITSAKKFLTVVKDIDKAFLLARLKVLAIVAVIAILALIVDDFINFLKGNDSVIGTIFDKAGIGADNARQAIFEAWSKISDFLLGIWEFIKQAAGMWMDTLIGFFEKHSESIRAGFERAWEIIKTFLSGVWTFISQLAVTLFGSTEDSIDGSTNSTKDNLLSVWQAILDALSAIWDALFDAGSAVFDAVATVIETVFGWIQTFWSNWGSQILSWFKVIWDSIGGIFNGFLEVVKGVANFVSSVFTGDWQGAWEAVKQIFTSIWDTMASFITAIWETIKLLFSMALSAIQAVWNSIWEAISGFFIGIWNNIVSFLQGIWSAITGIISGAINGAYNVIASILTAIYDFFSSIFGNISSFVSETFTNILGSVTNIVGSIKDAIVNGLTTAVDWIKGLPSQALTWGSDIVMGIVDGIKGAIGNVTDAVKGIADKIKSFLHFSVPDEGPLADADTYMPDFMDLMAQGINDNSGTVLDKVKKLTTDISAFSKAAVAAPQTAAGNIMSSISNTVTQNNTFQNTYSGSDVQAQKNVSKAMNNSSASATNQLAKALAYAR